EHERGAGCEHRQDAEQDRHETAERDRPPPPSPESRHRVLPVRRGLGDRFSVCALVAMAFSGAAIARSDPGASCTPAPRRVARAGARQGIASAPRDARRGACVPSIAEATRVRRLLPTRIRLASAGIGEGLSPYAVLLLGGGPGSLPCRGSGLSRQRAA